MIDSKKGMILYYFLIPGIILAFIYFMVLAEYISPDQNPRYPGKMQLHMIDAAQIADKMVLYASESAEIAAYESMPKMANNGGFASESECGQFYGYQTWSAQCKPSLMNEFEVTFNERIKSRLDTYPEKDKQFHPDKDFTIYPKIEQGHYRLFAQDKDLVGSTNKPVTVNLFVQKDPAGHYAIRPDFHIKTSYDFDVLKTIQEKMEAITATQSADIRPLLEAAFVEWNTDGAQWEANACIPETDEEVFWEVVEKVDWCMRSRKDDTIISCKCNLARTNLNLLGDSTITFEQGEQLIARLEKDGKTIRHTFDATAKLTFHKPDEEFSISGLTPTTSVVLGSNSLSLPAIDEQTSISPSFGLFRNKVNGNDMVAFIPDTARTELYEQFAECPLPPEEKIRLCVQTGTTPSLNQQTRTLEQKPVNFKIAVDVSGIY